MRIFVTVKAHAKEERIEEKSLNHLVISVRALPQQGKANNAVIKALSTHFGKPEYCFRLRSGATGKKKVFDYEDGL